MRPGIHAATLFPGHSSCYNSSVLCIQSFHLSSCLWNITTPKKTKNAAEPKDTITGSRGVLLQLSSGGCATPTRPVSTAGWHNSQTAGGGVS